MNFQKKNKIKYNNKFKMMKRLKKVAMTLTMMVMVISVVNAQEGPQQKQGREYGQRAGERREVKMDGLNLTDKQQEQIRSMKIKTQKDLLPIKNQLGENKAKMRTLSTVDNVDLKAINKLIDESSKLEASMTKLQMANHQEVRKLLTDEQRVMFDSREFRRGRNGQSNNQGHRQGRHGKQGKSQRPATPRSGK
jgi:Spy/CpxP family protein refolding chaperone